MNLNTSGKLPNTLLWIGVLVIGVWSFFPILWNFMTSLKTRSDIFAYPPKIFFPPNTEAYERILTPGGTYVIPNLVNSLAIGFGTTALTLIISCLAAYAFSRYTFFGRRELLFGVLATRLLPPFTAIVPLYQIGRALNLIDTWTILIVINAALNVPLAVWMMKTFIDGISRELEEASWIDGCSRLKSLTRIILPLARPGMTATAIFVFIMTWNEFLFALIFSGRHSKTLPVILSEMRGDQQIYWQDLTSIANILIVPMLIFALYMQKHMVKGLTTGAIK